MSPNKSIPSNDAPIKGTTTDQIKGEVETLLAWVVAASTLDLRSFEKQLLSRLWVLGRLLLTLFFETREASLRQTVSGLRGTVARNVATVFGEVRMWRTYVRGDEGHGYAPLDRALGLTADLVSANLLGLSVQLATQMPFDQVRAVLSLFVGYVPSSKTIKQAALGLGSLAFQWFELAPISPGDGQVLVVMFDSKGIPTATDRELKKRRGKRKKKGKAASPRHRGRQRRQTWQCRRKRGKKDMSKNARMCTVVTMFTLKRDGDQLLGPINKETFASFGPKELVFQWAQRRATKRGFGPDCGKTIQVVTDGDQNLADYTKRYLPHAIHTLDVYHALEYVWQAGTCLHAEGSPQLEQWYAKARAKVFGGRTEDLLKQLRAQLRRIPHKGPGNKGRRERLEQAIKYLSKRLRLHMMCYKQWRDLDLEIGSGAIEGVVKYLVALRFDHGGMRWIRERAQALLLLRCIHQNGQWDAFLDWALPLLAQPTFEQPVPRIQRTVPAPLPELAEAA